MQEAIIHHMRSWRGNPGHAFFTASSPCLREVLRGQTSLTWRRFLERWVHKEWHLTQQWYFNTIQSCRTGKQWTIALIKKLWDVAQDLWQHHNEVLHHRNNLVTLQAGRAMDRQIIVTFNRLTWLTLPIQERRLLRIPLRILLSKPAPYKAGWLQVAQPALGEMRFSEYRNKSAEHRMIAQMRSNMEAWLRQPQGRYQTRGLQYLTLGSDNVVWQSQLR